MSADNGSLIRRDERGQFVVQTYFASNEQDPPINEEHALRFYDLKAALKKVEEMEDEYPSEYGPTVEIKEVTLDP